MFKMHSLQDLCELRWYRFIITIEARESGSGGWGEVRWSMVGDNGGVVSIEQNQRYNIQNSGAVFVNIQKYSSTEEIVSYSTHHHDNRHIYGFKHFRQKSQQSLIDWLSTWTTTNEFKIAGCGIVKNWCDCIIAFNPHFRIQPRILNNVQL